MRVFLKHLWNKNFAYIAYIFLRTRFCWLVLGEFSDLHSIFRLRALRYSPQTAVVWKECLSHLTDVKSAACCRIIELLTKKTWRRDRVIFVEWKTKELKSKTPLRTGKYFEWIIKQLLNLAFEGHEEFWRSQRVLFTSAFGLCGLHPPWSAEFFISYAASFNCLFLSPLRLQSFWSAPRMSSE